MPVPFYFLAHRLLCSPFWFRLYSISAFLVHFSLESTTFLPISVYCTVSSFRLTQFSFDFLHLSVYSPYSPYSFSDYDLHYLLLRGSSTLRSFAAQTRLITLEALIGHPSISFVYMSTKLSLHCRFGHLFRCRSISFYDSYTSQLDLFFLRSHTLRMSLFI